MRSEGQPAPRLVAQHHRVAGGRARGPARPGRRSVPGPTTVPDTTAAPGRVATFAGRAPSRPGKPAGSDHWPVSVSPTSSTLRQSDGGGGWHRRPLAGSRRRWPRAGLRNSPVKWIHPSTTELRRPMNASTAYPARMTLSVA